jgi:hypothetical protein
MAFERMNIKVTLKEAELVKLLCDPVTMDRAVKHAAENVRNRARLLAPRDKGALLASLDYHLVIAPTAGNLYCEYKIDSPLKYSVYQEFGIGPVHARPGHYLRWMPKGTNVYVFAKSTRGFAGRHYLLAAFHTLTLRDFIK